MGRGRLRKFKTPIGSEPTSRSEDASGGLEASRACACSRTVVHLYLGGSQPTLLSSHWVAELRMSCPAVDCSFYFKSKGTISLIGWIAALLWLYLPLDPSQALMFAEGLRTKSCKVPGTSIFLSHAICSLNRSFRPRVVIHVEGGLHTCLFWVGSLLLPHQVWVVLSW